MQSMLNEGSFIDFMKNSVNSDRDRNNKNGRAYLKGSIAKYTNNLVMSFPMICDSSLPIDTLTMISISNEHNIATKFQIAFSSMSLKGENGIEILRSFYKGLDDKSAEEMIDFLDSLVFDVKAESVFSESEIRQTLHEMVDYIKNEQFVPIESFSEKSLTDYLVYGNDTISVREANGDYEQRRADKLADDEKKRTNRLEDNQLKSALTSNIEVKKQNQLPPSLIQINFADVAADGVMISKSFLAGIKSRIILADSMDIVERIAVKDNSGKSGFQKFVKWTTGELSLTKAIASSLEKIRLRAKNDVKDKDGGVSKLWKALEKRSNSSKIQKILRSSNDASSITSLVLSQETVNYLKSTYNFDIERVKNVRYIMDVYNFLSVYIADEANEVVKVIYDSDSNYEYLSYTSLHKDTSDKNYKKMINLLNNQR